MIAQLLSGVYLGVGFALGSAAAGLLGRVLANLFGVKHASK